MKYALALLSLALPAGPVHAGANVFRLSAVSRPVIIRNPILGETLLPMLPETPLWPSRPGEDLALEEPATPAPAGETQPVAKALETAAETVATLDQEEQGGDEQAAALEDLFDSVLKPSEQFTLPEEDLERELGLRPRAAR